MFTADLHDVQKIKIKTTHWAERTVTKVTFVGAKGDLFEINTYTDGQVPAELQILPSEKEYVKPKDADEQSITL